ncbi:MAG: adenosine kinase [Acidimicrobiia bacterium]|nr:adenosine kinase [Acidimicrobiia bacterium]
MTLVDADRSAALYGAFPPAIEVSGGSAANTIAGVASFGSSVAYIGKVRDDQLGEVYRHDLRAAGVTFDVPAAAAGPETGRCLIVVTPDAERTMSTYLGISTMLEPADVDEALCREAGVLYCEGYVWDAETAKAAIRKAMAATKAAGGKCALTLSDGFCVDRHRDEFLGLLEEYVDVLFANQSEICSLYEVDDVDKAIDAVAGQCEVAAVTMSARGSTIVTRDARIEVPAWSTGVVLDTTGAGDQYAAGFLSGYARGADLERCGRLGSLAAGEVISHVGPRPATSLAGLARDQRLS